MLILLIFIIVCETIYDVTSYISKINVGILGSVVQSGKCDVTMTVYQLFKTVKIGSLKLVESSLIPPVSTFKSTLHNWPSVYLFHVNQQVGVIFIPKPLLSPLSLNKTQYKDELLSVSVVFLLYTCNEHSLASLIVNNTYRVIG